VDGSDSAAPETPDLDRVIPRFGGQHVDSGAAGDKAVQDSTPAADLAQSVLADLRAARGEEVRPARRARQRNGTDASGAREQGRRNRGGYSAARPDPRSDPQPVGRLVGDFLAEQGWEAPLADARVFAEWARLVGPDVAAHCAPQTLRDGELHITAESTAWATQLRLLTRVLLARLADELGSGVVRKVSITGPVGPSWKHGGRSVRGFRGPRDTYG
jgi:predicted nucleic acid-binding Zn ribbon protein